MPQNNFKYISDPSFNIESINHQIDWLNWAVVLLCAITIISCRISDYNYIPNLFKQKNNFNSSQITLKKFSSLALLLNYYLIGSLFIWQILIITKSSFISSNLLFAIILGGLIGINIIKFLFISLIDLIFKRKIHFHIKLHISYFQISGLILFPIYVLSFFAPLETKVTTYIIAGILFGLTLIIRELKSLFIALNNRISFLYIILYLCTLEILPLILAIKILKG